MCGIFGIVLAEKDDIYKLIINGLIQLQNRGYDSAGLCVLNDDHFEISKYASTNDMLAIDKLNSLQLETKNEMFIGFGHNRWATHGMKNDVNAHPHLSNNNAFSIVHNGIIENYLELKIMLTKRGYSFRSQTDTEVIVNLIEYYYTTICNTYSDSDSDSDNNSNVFNAIQKTIQDLRGTYGLIIQSIFEPYKLYCVRNGSPLLVGQNDNCVIITSEQSGFSGIVQHYFALHNDDICTITRSNANIHITTNQLYKNKKITHLESELTPHPYSHWTLKEINEQPTVILNSLNKGGRIKNEYEVKLGGLDQHTDALKNVDNIILLGCGTSYFACLYGMHFFKKICKFNTVQAFEGAEFNEHDIPKQGTTIFILVSQSGETKDLHRCIEIAKNRNISTIGIINVVDSLIAREVDCGVYCNAGKEVAVASTKAFTSQVICLTLTAIWFSTMQEVNAKMRQKIINDLNSLSYDIQNTIDSCREKIKELALLFNRANNMFLLGKGSDEYIAKEGALKIKEISYIHSEGYSASSLKHGPFALLDENFPVVIMNLDQNHRSKIINCYQEVASRNAPVLFITNDINIVDEISCNYIVVPENKSFASLLGIVPIQLLAYFLSVGRGINPDKPKNLAKVVTVE
jgi:glucosamine--fructose-6-phosphate aminotransferase (isomerizing)